MKKLLLSITIIFTLSVSAQTYNSLISDNQVIDFIDWHINRSEATEIKTIDKNILLWDTITSVKNNPFRDISICFLFEKGVSTFEGYNLDSIFTQEDKIYIYWNR